jgi:hypothetical protein
MISQVSPRLLLSRVAAVIVLALVAGACAGTTPSAVPNTPATRKTVPSATASSTVTPAGPWSALLLRTPFPYTTPLPPAAVSPLDGTYVKFDPRAGTRVPCRRCPPYPPEAGLWKLHLAGGIFRIYHAPTGWHTLGSFTTSGDRLTLFNDPHCYQDTGHYHWRLASGQLVLTAIQDPCGTDLRARSLTERAWDSCQPPNQEAAATGHWPVPPGCEE